MSKRYNLMFTIDKQSEDNEFLTNNLVSFSLHQVTLTQIDELTGISIDALRELEEKSENND